jgi:hypothetical protein
MLFILEYSDLKLVLNNQGKRVSSNNDLKEMFYMLLRLFQCVFDTDFTNFHKLICVNL